MPANAANTQNALPAIEAELQFEVMNSSVVSGLSYVSDRFVSDGNERTDAKSATPNVIARKNLFENKWMIFTKPLQAGINVTLGDAKAGAANNTEFASCNAGVNTMSFSVQGPGHNARKAFRQVINDPSGLAKNVLQNQSIPKINMEFFIGAARGASDILANDPFYASGSAVYGVSSLATPQHSYNYGTIDGDTVSLIPQIPNTAYDNGVAWNTAVNAALGTFSGATAALPTYNTIVQLEQAASKRRIQNIKGRGHSYVFICAPEVANNIHMTAPGQRTLTTEKMEDLNLNASVTFRVNNTLVIGTPWVYSTYINNIDNSEVYDYGTIADRAQSDFYAINPTTPVIPAYFFGTDAILTGDDWTLRFTEDEAVSNPEREGKAYFLDIDTGFTRAEYRRPIANYRNADGSIALPLIYKNCLINQNSIVLATRIG